MDRLTDNLDRQPETLKTQHASMHVALRVLRGRVCKYEQQMKQLRADGNNDNSDRSLLSCACSRRTALEYAPARSATSALRGGDHDEIDNA